MVAIFLSWVGGPEGNFENKVWMEITHQSESEASGNKEILEKKVKDTLKMVKRMKAGVIY